MNIRTIIVVSLYCLSMALGVTLCLYQEASRWGFFDFYHLLHLSCFIFTVSVTCSLAFDSIAVIRVSRISAVAAVLCGILSASALYSLVHGDIILIVFPSLFCAPGAIAGYIIKDAIAPMIGHKVSAAKAMRMPKISGSPESPLYDSAGTPTN
jgi:hypothetical protein